LTCAAACRSTQAKAAFAYFGSARAILIHHSWLVLALPLRGCKLLPQLRGRGCAALLWLPAAAASRKGEAEQEGACALRPATHPAAASQQRQRHTASMQLATGRCSFRPAAACGVDAAGRLHKMRRTAGRSAFFSTPTSRSRPLQVPRKPQEYLPSRLLPLPLQHFATGRLSASQLGPLLSAHDASTSPRVPLHSLRRGLAIARGARRHSPTYNIHLRLSSA